MCLVVCAILCLALHGNMRQHRGHHKDLVIVTAHYKENLDWLKESPYPVIVCDKPGSKKSAFVPNAQCSLTKNIGREASVFLKFVIEYYDALPAHIAFVHGHETAWHQKLPWGVLESIDRARLDTYSYINLNNVRHSKVFDPAQPYKGRVGPHVEYRHKAHTLLQRYWDSVFGPILNIPFPNHLQFQCCAQFVVSRDAILRHPKDAYVKLYEFVTDSSIGTDWERAVALECIWHVLWSDEGPDMCLTDTKCADYVATHFHTD